MLLIFLQQKNEQSSNPKWENTTDMILIMTYVGQKSYLVFALFQIFHTSMSSGELVVIRSISALNHATARYTFFLLHYHCSFAKIMNQIFLHNACQSNDFVNLILSLSLCLYYFNFFILL